MDIQDFKTIIDTYGANPERWPEQHRDAMLDCQAQRPDDVEPILAAARQLDRALNQARPIHPSDLLMARVMAKAPRPFLSDWRQVAAAAALTLMVGVAGGYASGTLVGPSEFEADYYADAFDGLDVEWEISMGDGA